MANLQQEIDRLRTLQESYDAIVEKVGGASERFAFVKNNDGDNTYSVVVGSKKVEGETIYL